jgi:tetratricopeptide (TPR) repeat protein
MRRSSVMVLPAIALVIAIAAVGCDRGTTVESGMADRLARADEVFKSREYEEAGKLYQALAGEADAAGDVSTYVEASAMRARSYLIREEGEKGRPWLEKAAARANAADPLGWSRYLGVRGRFEWRDGDNETATRTFLEMFDYCQKHELWERAVDAAHMIAITGDPGEKFEWATRGIEMAEKGEMTGWLGPLWNNLGWDYVDAGRYEEALDALVKARWYHYQGAGELPKLIADYSVAHVTRLAGRLDEAEAGMRAVFDWAERLNGEDNPDALEWMGFSRWDLGEIAVSRGDVPAGLAMMEEAVVELEAAGMPRWDAEGWKEKQDRIAEIKG